MVSAAHQAPLPVKQGLQSVPNRDDHFRKFSRQTGEAVAANERSPLRLLGRVVGERIAQWVRPYGQRRLPAGEGRLGCAAERGSIELE